MSFVASILSRVVLLISIGVPLTSSALEGLDMDHVRAVRAATEARYAAIHSILNQYRAGRSDINNPISSMHASYNLELDTILVMPRSELVLPDPKALVVFLHGTGMTYSSAGSWHQVLQVLGTNVDSKTRRRILEFTDYQNVLPIAFDMPFHRGGTDDFWMPNRLTSHVNYVARVLALLKRKYSSLPLVVVARSAGAAFAAEVNFRYPQLIDGLSLMSPTIPGDEKKSEELLAGAVAEAGTENLTLPLIDRYFRMFKRVNWQKENYFQNTPIFAVTGELDTQVLDEDREFLFKLSQERSSYFSFMNLEGVGHNLLETTNAAKRKGAYQTYEQLFHLINEAKQHQKHGNAAQNQIAKILLLRASWVKISTLRAD